MNVPAWYGAYAAAAGLLAAAGGLKVVKPKNTALALQAIGLPHARLVVRVGAAVELVIGIGAIVAGGAVYAGLLALSYAGFAVFVAVAMRKGTPVSSCGCFGEADAPPTLLHIVLNLAAASLATAAVFDPAPSLTAILDDPSWTLLPLALLTVTGAYLSFVIMAVLPGTLSAVRGDHR